jgi:hypothetical protein
LRYFAPIIDEIVQQKLDPDYWEFLRTRIQRHEKLWIEKHREEKDLESETVTGSSE